MSEEAKIAYIQERLREVRSNERYGTILGLIGALMTGIGFALSSVLGQSMWIVGVLGILLIICGAIYGAYYAIQRMKLMKQLKTMSITIPKCPKCGKELPKGDFTFCPFCGVSLERK